jgi:peroxiredoxin/cytochrome c-type biogenesis protein CcmH/NrfG
MAAFVESFDGMEQKFQKWPLLTLTPVILTAVFLMLVLATPNLVSDSAKSLAQQPAASYEEEMASGREFLRRGRWEDALKSLKRANELKGKTSAETFYMIAVAYMGLEAYKNVAQSCDSAVQFAGDDVELKAKAYNLKGVALQKQADIKDLKRLQEAEAALRQAIAVKSDFNEARYNLGFVLLQQNRDPEGIEELKKYLETTFREAEDPRYAIARKLIENPRRAREPFAPDFSFTTAEGEFISLEELKGKVVLLDFWGTWCPPCVASVPALRDLNKKYSKEASFVMIGVSSDGDEEKWRAFTAREKMVWPQYLDRDHQMQKVFSVRAFPTYIVIDPEGVIRYRAVGMSFEKEANLADAINKAIKRLSKPAE